MGDGIVRVRAPHNVHILSWVLSLEKTGTVSCHFKKCKFMAMTVEEMANHYIYCKCDNVDLPHECDVCKQKTDCLMKLLYHKIYSHSYNATSEELRNLSGFLSCKREITTPLRRAWKIFLDNKGYLICLKKTCAYVLESIEEMEEHFLHECKEDFWNKLTLACEKCNGRFYNQHKLKAHFSVVHNQSQRKGRIVKPVVSDETLLKEWATAIINHKQAKCPVEQCKFVCNSISTLAKHYKYCNGERKYSVSCPICHCWVVNEDKLTEHRKVIHKDTEPFICKPEIDDKSWILESNPLEDDEVDEFPIEIQSIDSDRSSLKKYLRVNKPEVNSNRKPKPHALCHNNTDSIDWAPKADMSRIQFTEDIVSRNRLSLDIVNVNSSFFGKILNEGSMENTQNTNVSSNKLKQRIGLPSFKQKATKSIKPTPLEMVAHEVMEDNKNQSTVSVQIKIDDIDWTVNVPKTIVAPAPSKDNFPMDGEALLKCMRKQSLKMLEVVTKKTSIRADVRKVFDFSQKRLAPFKISVKSSKEGSNPKDNKANSSIRNEASDMTMDEAESIEIDVASLRNNETEEKSMPIPHSSDINLIKLEESNEVCHDILENTAEASDTANKSLPLLITDECDGEAHSPVNNSDELIVKIENTNAEYYGSNGNIPLGNHSAFIKSSESSPVHSDKNSLNTRNSNEPQANKTRNPPLTSGELETESFCEGYICKAEDSSGEYDTHDNSGFVGSSIKNQNSSQESHNFENDRNVFDIEDPNDEHPGAEENMNYSSTSGEVKNEPLILAEENILTVEDPDIVYVISHDDNEILNNKNVSETDCSNEYNDFVEQIGGNDTERVNKDLNLLAVDAMSKENSLDNYLDFSKGISNEVSDHNNSLNYSVENDSSIFIKIEKNNFLHEERDVKSHDTISDSEFDSTHEFDDTFSHCSNSNSEILNVADKDEVEPRDNCFEEINGKGRYNESETESIETLQLINVAISQDKSCDNSPEELTTDQISSSERKDDFKDEQLITENKSENRFNPKQSDAKTSVDCSFTQLSEASCSQDSVLTSDSILKKVLQGKIIRTESKTLVVPNDSILIDSKLKCNESDFDSPVQEENHSERLLVDVNVKGKRKKRSMSFPTQGDEKAGQEFFQGFTDDMLSNSAFQKFLSICFKLGVYDNNYQNSPNDNEMNKRARSQSMISLTSDRVEKSFLDDSMITQRRTGSSYGTERLEKDCTVRTSLPGTLFINSQQINTSLNKENRDDSGLPSIELGLPCNGPFSTSVSVQDRHFPSSTSPENPKDSSLHNQSNVLVSNKISAVQEKILKKDDTLIKESVNLISLQGSSSVGISEKKSLEISEKLIVKDKSGNTNANSKFESKGPNQEISQQTCKVYSNLGLGKSSFTESSTLLPKRRGRPPKKSLDVSEKGVDKNVSENEYVNLGGEESATQSNAFVNISKDKVLIDSQNTSVQTVLGVPIEECSAEDTKFLEGPDSKKQFLLENKFSPSDKQSSHIDTSSKINKNTKESHQIILPKTISENKFPGFTSSKLNGNFRSYEGPKRLKLSKTASVRSIDCSSSFLKCSRDLARANSSEATISQIHQLFSDIDDYSSIEGELNEFFDDVVDCNIINAFESSRNLLSQNPRHGESLITPKSVHEVKPSPSSSSSVRMYKNRRRVSVNTQTNKLRSLTMSRDTNSSILSNASCSMDQTAVNLDENIFVSDDVSGTPNHNNGLAKEQLVARCDSPQLIGEDSVYQYFAEEPHDDINENNKPENTNISFSDIHCANIYEKSFLGFFPCTLTSTPLKRAFPHTNVDQFDKKALYNSDVDSSKSNGSKSQNEISLINPEEQSRHKNEKEEVLNCNTHVDDIKKYTRSIFKQHPEKADFVEQPCSNNLRKTEERLALSRNPRRDRPPKGYYKKMSKFSDVSAAVASGDRLLASKLSKSAETELTCLNKRLRTKSCDVDVSLDSMPKGGKRKRNESESDINKAKLNRDVLSFETLGSTTVKPLNNMSSKEPKKRSSPRKLDNAKNVLLNTDSDQTFGDSSSIQLVPNEHKVGISNASDSKVTSRNNILIDHAGMQSFSGQENLISTQNHLNVLDSSQKRVLSSQHNITSNQPTEKPALSIDASSLESGSNSVDEYCDSNSQNQSVSEPSLANKMIVNTQNVLPDHSNLTDSGSELPSGSLVRKRGRPAKRKVGRPKKSDDLTKSNENVSEVSSSLDKNGPEAQFSDNQLTPKAPVPSRKRGRPPKRPSVSLTGENEKQHLIVSENKEHEQTALEMDSLPKHRDSADLDVTNDNSLVQSYDKSTFSDTLSPPIKRFKEENGQTSSNESFQEYNSSNCFNNEIISSNLSSYNVSENNFENSKKVTFLEKMELINDKSHSENKNLSSIIEGKLSHKRNIEPVQEINHLKDSKQHSNPFDTTEIESLECIGGLANVDQSLSEKMMETNDSVYKSSDPSSSIATKMLNNQKCEKTPRKRGRPRKTSSEPLKEALPVEMAKAQTDSLLSDKSLHDGNEKVDSEIVKENFPFPSNDRYKKLKTYSKMCRSKYIGKGSVDNQSRTLPEKGELSIAGNGISAKIENNLLRQSECIIEHSDPSKIKRGDLQPNKNLQQIIVGRSFGNETSNKEDLESNNQSSSVDNIHPFSKQKEVLKRSCSAPILFFDSTESTEVTTDIAKKHQDSINESSDTIKNKQLAQVKISVLSSSELKYVRRTKSLENLETFSTALKSYNSKNIGPNSIATKDYNQLLMKRNSLNNSLDESMKGAKCPNQLIGTSESRELGFNKTKVKMEPERRISSLPNTEEKLEESLRDPDELVPQSDLEVSRTPFIRSSTPIPKRRGRPPKRRTSNVAEIVSKPDPISKSDSGILKVNCSESNRVPDILEPNKPDSNVRAGRKSFMEYSSSIQKQRLPKKSLDVSEISDKEQESQNICLIFESENSTARCTLANQEDKPKEGCDVSIQETVNPHSIIKTSTPLPKRRGRPSKKSLDVSEISDNEPSQNTTINLGSGKEPLSDSNTLLPNPEGVQEKSIQTSGVVPNREPDNSNFGLGNSSRENSTSIPKRRGRPSKKRLDVSEIAHNEPTQKTTINLGTEEEPLRENNTSVPNPEEMQEKSIQTSGVISNRELDNSNFGLGNSSSENSTSLPKRRGRPPRKGLDVSEKIVGKDDPKNTNMNSESRKEPVAERHAPVPNQKVNLPDRLEASDILLSNEQSDNAHSNLSAGNTFFTENSTQLPKRRGRPPKKSLNVSESLVTEEQSENKSIISENVKLESENNSTAESQASITNEKVNLLKCEVSNTLVFNQEPDNAHSNLADGKSSFTESTTPFPKRKGRPPKKIVDVSEVLVSKEDSENKSITSGKESENGEAEKETTVENKTAVPNQEVNHLGCRVSDILVSNQLSGNVNSNLGDGRSPFPENSTPLPKRRGRPPKKSLNVSEILVDKEQNEKTHTKLESAYANSKTQNLNSMNSNKIYESRGGPVVGSDSPVQDQKLLLEESQRVSVLASNQESDDEHSNFGDEKKSFKRSSTPLPKRKGRPPRKSLCVSVTVRNGDSENKILSLESGNSPLDRDIAPLTNQGGKPEENIETSVLSESKQDHDYPHSNITNENSSIFDSSTPLPKRRGRPPGRRPNKSLDVAVNSNFDDSETSLILNSRPKRRRMPPRRHSDMFSEDLKAKNAFFLENSTQSHNQSESMNDFDPMKSEESQTEAEISLTSQPTPSIKRKRGRPKRNPELNTTIEELTTPDSNAAPKKKAGRPRKYEREDPTINNMDRETALKMWEESRYLTDQDEEEDDDDDSTGDARNMRRKPLTGRIDASSFLRDPSKLVRCAICKEVMTVKFYKNSHLLKHNFLAWLEGEKPLPLDDTEAMVNHINRGKKYFPKHQLRCSTCNSVKKSAAGFLSHLQFCGKSDLEREKMLVTCELCGRVLVPASLGPHMYQSHSQSKETKAFINEEVLPGDAVRKAAAKCLDKIADYVGEEGEENKGKKVKKEKQDSVDYDEEVDEKRELRLLYITVKRRPTKNLKLKWNQILMRGEAVRCPIPSCDFTTTKYEEIVKHMPSCPLEVQSYSCIKCNMICSNEDGMREHVKLCNPPIALSRSDSSDCEDSDKPSLIPFLRREEQKLSHSRVRVHFFKPALTWMNTIWNTNFNTDPLFPELYTPAGLENGVCKEESKKYNPQITKSLKVSHDCSDWREMDFLEGQVSKDGEAIGFSGGPIWGLAWCPGEGEQFLATSPQLSMESNFQVGSTDTGPAVVHLWSLGNINNAFEKGAEFMKFSFGICHEEKGAWELAWCPGGGRTNDRLGLLALATVSGSIPIFAVPQPTSLPLDRTRFFKLDPVIKLELYSTERWQCSAISWSKLKPHRIIAAGFVNGIIAVWDLSSQSTLLRSHSNKVLQPFKIFQAHNSFITGICLSPESENYLASSSFDKSFKFWDLRDTTAPQSITKRGLFTDVDWLRHWMMAVTSYDIAYTMSQTTVGLSFVRDLMSPSMQVVTSTNSTCWSVSANDWLNCIAASYDNGQAMIIFALKHIVTTHKEKKKYSKIIVQSSLEELSTPSAEEACSSSTSSKVGKAGLENENLPLLGYECASKKYGLKISTEAQVKEFGRIDNLKENSSEGQIDVYPLNSINKIAWNPNQQSFCYLAMGYQSGFILVTKLSFPPLDQQMINSFSKNSENSDTS